MSEEKREYRPPQKRPPQQRASQQRPPQKRPPQQRQQQKRPPKKKWQVKLHKLKVKAIRFGKYVWTECKDWRTLVLFVIVMVLAYTPVWLGYSLYFLFRWKWCIAMATGYMLFWAGPFTPFIPLCIAITLTIKRVLWMRGMLPEPGNTKEKRVTVYEKPKEDKKKDSFFKSFKDLLKYMLKS